MSDSEQNEEGAAVAVAEALVARARELFDRGVYEEALALYDEVVKCAQQSRDVRSPALVSLALFRRGLCLGRLGRGDEAVAAYDDLVTGFADVDELVVKERVAQALLNKGALLGRADRHEDAIAVYRDVVARYEDATESKLREKVALAFLRTGIRLGKLGLDEDAIAVYDELAERFRDADEVLVGERVAQALLNKGLALDRSGRHEEEIDVYAQVIARYGGSVDRGTLRVAGRALYNKALALVHLERRSEAIAAYGELINRFGGATDPKLRARVSWALWKKTNLLDDLNRSDEAEPIYDELIERHDEDHDPGLANNISWCLEHKAQRLRASGQSHELLELYDEIVRRFGEATDAELRQDVVNAFTRKAGELERLGRHDDEIATYDELARRFGTAPEGEIRAAVAGNLNRKAYTLEQIGRVDETIAAYDDALAVLGDSTTDPVIRAERVAVLLRKGVALYGLKRHAESVLIIDSAITAYLDCVAQHGGLPDLEQAALALHYEVGSLCVLDRAGELPRLRDRLVTLLGDVAEPGSSAPQPRREPMPEKQIAGFLDEILKSDYWQSIATSGNDPGSLKNMADRAVALYLQTESWLTPEVEVWDTSAVAALMLLRQLADGYAMRAGQRPGDLSGLPLMTRAAAEWAIRNDGVDEWAAELGHPLDLQESTDEVDELIAQQRHQAEQPKGPEFAASFAAAVWQRELLTALCDSQLGRQVLQGENFKTFASRRVSDARSWGARLMLPDDEATAAIAARLFTAQAYFIAAYHGVPTSAALFPRPDAIRSFLRQLDGYEWLDAQELELPAWLTDH